MKSGKHKNQSFRFVAAFVLCLVTALVGYGLIFRFKVVRDPTIIPVSYKQLLLEEIPGARILIESGSNGLHAFDPQLVESLTGYPTLIMADHAGASLHDKVERLWKYAHEGDIVILPLEWNYYHAPDLSENHLKSLLNRGRGYYYSLPLWQQLCRAFETPLAVVTRELLLPIEERHGDYFEELQRLQFYHDHNLQKAPNGEVVIAPETESLPKDSDCDGYIIPEFANGPIQYTDAFRHSLEKLAALERERGVKVILTAPIVVGADCYGKYGDFLVPMVSQAEALCKRLGISCLLDYHRYAMPVEYLLDTHFHVTEEGSEVVTPLVIGDLVEAGWIEPQSLNPDNRVASHMGRILNQERLKLMSHKMPMWRGNPTAVVDGDDRGYFYFGEDWYEEETWGRWSKTEAASIIVRLNPDYRYSGLFINANYFAGSQQTRVFINDQLVAEQDFTKQHLIEFEKPLIEILNGEQLAQIRFESMDSISPRALDGSSDIRALKFGLHSLELIVE